jgi:hypothetical protein
MDHEGTFRGPVEPPAPPPAPAPPASGFLAGVLAGIALAAIGAQFWMARHLEPMAMWSEYGTELRSLTKLAVSATWRWGMPCACAGGLAALFALRVRRPIVYGIAAAVAVSLLALTYLWATAPLHELAGRIRGE